jgi:hypothetical protein
MGPWRACWRMMQIVSGLRPSLLAGVHGPVSSPGPAITCYTSAGIPWEGPATGPRATLLCSLTILWRSSWLAGSWGLVLPHAALADDVSARRCIVR